MSAAPARRGFLRGLATLPLIGGGVTIIGHPTAAAVPVSDALLSAYDEWLDLERSFLKWERFGPEGINDPDRTMVEAVFRNRHTGQLFDYRSCSTVSASMFWGTGAPQPSTRAAVVLSAVGANWRA